MKNNPAAFTIFLAAAILILSAFSSPSQASPLDIKEVKSPGGLSAWLVEDHSVPVLALSFAFKHAGSKNETAETQGLARMLSNTLDEGAGDLDATAFQKELLDRSISLGFTADRDNFGGTLKTLTRHKDRAFDLLKLALTKPRFDQEAVDRMREANLTRIRSSLANPDWIAARLMNDVAYKNHPYALNSGGTLSSLPAVTPEALRTYLKAQLSRDRLTIGVAGDITADELAPLLDRLFGDLPAQSQTFALPPDIEPQGAGTITLFEKDIPQTVVEIIGPGISRNDPEYHTAEILNYVLGGSGFGSRLMEEVREKRGLTYGIYSGLLSMDHADALTIGASTKNASVSELIDLTKAEADKLRENGVTDQELADAQSYLIGSVPLSLTSTDRIAGLLLSMQSRGYQTDYLETREAALRKTTREDIRALAEKLLDPSRFTVILVGKPEGVKPTNTVTTLPNAE